LETTLIDITIGVGGGTSTCEAVRSRQLVPILKMNASVKGSYPSESTSW
jgi:hypothetical protein